MIHTEPSGVRKKQPYQNDEANYLRKIKKSASQPIGDVALIFRIAVVEIATTITPLSITHARGVTAPAIRSRPKTNSTVETRKAFNSGKGIRASRSVWRICSGAYSQRVCLAQRERKVNRLPSVPGESRPIAM